MDVELLHYREWKGTFVRPAWSIWPMARVALVMLFRRRLFWVLYAFGLLVFLMFFFGGYLLDWAATQMASANVQVGGRRLPSDRLIEGLRRGVAVLNGGGQTFAYFFRIQGAMLMVTLALTGALLVGNDFIYGSVPFYLSKPLSRWHYILGKCLAVGVVVNLMTTLPALVLFAQHGLGDYEYLLDSDYFLRTGSGHGPAGLPLLLGILAYGLLITVVLSLLLVAIASWVRRTMPLIMVWTTLFLFFRMLSEILVQGLHYHERWRLMDLWNDMRLVGCFFLQMEHQRIDPQPQPATWEAALVLAGTCLLCLSYLNRKTRAVEVVT